MRGRFFLCLAFALFAGLSAVAALAVAGPFLGAHMTSWLLAIPAVALYAFLIAPNLAVGARVGLTAFFLASIPWFLGLPPALRWFGPVFALALVRSGWLFRRSLARSVVIEIGLATAGFLLARLLIGPSVLGWGMAFWAYFLVQSLFFLIADLEEAPSSGADSSADAFELAHQRAVDLMEGRI